MNRSQMFSHLFSLKTWTEYEWSKRTGITRTTFGNNRKNDGKTVKTNTLEKMALACGLELRQENKDQGIRPNSKEAIFSVSEAKDSIDKLKQEIDKLKEENEMLRRLVGRN